MVAIKRSSNSPAIFQGCRRGSRGAAGAAIDPGPSGAHLGLGHRKPISSADLDPLVDARPLQARPRRRDRRTAGAA